MAKVKGKFIKMTGMLMLKSEVALADEYLISEIGCGHKEIKEEDWYETKLMDKFFKICAENSIHKDEIYITIGKKVYPTIKMSVGLPPHLTTPLDYIKFEAEGFLMNHLGEDVSPRKFISAKEGEVVVEAKAPGYNSKLYEGVWLGILEMIGIRSGKVVNDGNDVFTISW
jgi:hypothetical protein